MSGYEPDSRGPVPSPPLRAAVVVDTPLLAQSPASPRMTTATPPLTSSPRGGSGLGGGGGYEPDSGSACCGGGGGGGGTSVGSYQPDSRSSSPRGGGGTAVGSYQPDSRSFSPRGGGGGGGGGGGYEADSGSGVAVAPTGTAVQQQGSTLQQEIPRESAVDSQAQPQQSTSSLAKCVFVGGSDQQTDETSHNAEHQHNHAGAAATSATTTTTCASLSGVSAPLLSSAKTDPKGFGQSVEWTTRFQDALDRVNGCITEDHRTVQHHINEIEAWTAVRDVAVDFVYSAVSYGKIIIGEMFLDDEQKTIRSRSKDMGFAGGEKFIVNGILFKFARDNKNLFDHDDELAAKCAGHELKSCIRFFDAAGSQIRVPLMATIDYLGFRLSAISILPITRSTLVYGSSDGGETMHKEDEEASSRMKTICQSLNLKEHRCGRARPLVNLYGPTDIEVHKTGENQYFVLDMARLFPPETTVDGVPGCYLHRLLRPELILTSPRPLSSDVFTKFAEADRNREESNTDVEELSSILHNRVIPQFAAELNALCPHTKPSYDLEKTFVPRMHAAGINCRHLGEVWQHSNDIVKAVLTTEIASRSIKKLTQTPFCRLIVRYFNLVFNRTVFDLIVQRREDFIDREGQMKSEWEHVIHPRMLQFQGYNQSWVNSMKTDYLGVYYRLKEMMGIEFYPEAVQKFYENGITFSDPDLKSLPLKIKHMDLYSIADGHLLALDAVRRAPDTSQHILQKSIDAFKTVISANPKSGHHYYDLAKSQLQLGIHQNYVALINEARESFETGQKVGLKLNLHQKNATKIAACSLAVTFAEFRVESIYQANGTITALLMKKKSIYVGRKDGAVEKLFRKPKTVMAHRARVLSLLAWEQGFLTLCSDGSLNFWRKKSTHPDASIPFPFEPRCVFRCSSKLIVGGGCGIDEPVGFLRMWDIPAVLTSAALEKDPINFEHIEGSVYCCAASVENNYVLCGGVDGLRVWNMSTGELVVHEKATIHTRINCVALVDNGASFLTGSEDGLVWHYGIKQPFALEPLRLLLGHASSVHSIQVQASPKVAFTGSSDRTLRVWDLLSGVCVRVLLGSEVLQLQMVTVPGSDAPLIAASSMNEVRVYSRVQQQTTRSRRTSAPSLPTVPSVGLFISGLATFASGTHLKH
ncbi:Histidine kinase A [Pelomyxa schiedti]|nr:Histidine kinase A [Pelomyxa schiedti]